MYLRCRTVSYILHELTVQSIFDIVSFSDISFLCEATTALMIQEQQKQSALPQRTTDKSVIRATIPPELQQEPVRFFRNVCFSFSLFSIVSRTLFCLKRLFHKNFV